MNHFVKDLGISLNSGSCSLKKRKRKMVMTVGLACSGSHELHMCTCHVDKRKWSLFTIQKKGLSIPVLRVHGHFITKKK